MGQMQKNLEDMLTNAGWKTMPGKYNRLTIEDIKKHGFYDEVQNTFAKLGGIHDLFPIRFGGWDMEFDNVVIELDEQRHFNRYRLHTLGSDIYRQLNSFPQQLYKEYCINHEEQCLKAGGFGGNWSNPSCEKYFGNASDLKDLSGNGSPRWKQRAFYDFLKDISIITNRIPLVRISIWDSLIIDGIPILVMDVLKKNDHRCVEGLKALIQQRIPQ